MEIRRVYPHTGQMEESGHADAAHVPPLVNYSSDVCGVKGQAGTRHASRPLLLKVASLHQPVSPVYSRKQGDIFPGQLIWSQHMHA